MSKIVMLGDTHFGGRGDSIAFQNYFKRFFDDVFFPYLIDNDIDTVIQAGDLFDRRKYINFHTLRAAKDMFFSRFEELGINLYTFPGNHDLYYKNTSEINSLKELIDGIPNVHIAYDPIAISFGDIDIDLIPWINENNNEVINTFIKKSTSDMCVGHFEIEGFELLKGVMAQGEMKSNIFSDYHSVFSGHYHHESKKGNIHYIGTPYEMTWSDFNDPKGFHVLDTKTKKTNKILNPYNMFNRVIYDEDKLDDFDYEYLRESIIKLVVKSKSDDKFETFLEALYEVSPVDISIVDNSSLDEEDIDIEDIDTEDTITTIMKNVDNINDGNIDKNKMKILIQEIYNEAVELGREA